MEVLFPGSVPRQLSPKYDRHLPRAPSPAQGVTPCGMTSWVTWEGVTLPSSLLRAHAPDQNPLSASVFPCTKSLRRLWRIPAGNWPFPTLSLRILLHVSGPLPRLLLWCVYPFLPTELRPSQQSNPVGAQHNPYYSNFSMGEFRGCSHSLMFKPVDLLATQIAPTAANISFLAEQPWLLHPNTSRFVTSPRPGYANRPIRATDGKRTCTSQDSQPCRLFLDRFLPLLQIEVCFLCLPPG